MVGRLQIPYNKRENKDVIHETQKREKRTNQTDIQKIFNITRKVSYSKTKTSKRDDERINVKVIKDEIKT